MTEELNPSSSKQSPDTGVMAVDALARRRVLLSGLGKGSVVLAAASVPMATLANTSTRCKTDGNGNGGKPVWATVSGCHSAVGSRIPVDTPVAQGHHCSHYNQKSCWPGYNSDRSKDTSCVNKKFKDIFGGSDSRTCYQIVTTAPSSASCRWVTAYLNAHTCQSKWYPYDANEVVTHYKLAGSRGYPSRQDCEDFFGRHMESCS